MTTKPICGYSDTSTRKMVSEAPAASCSRPARQVGGPGALPWHADAQRADGHCGKHGRYHGPVRDTHDDPSGGTRKDR